jgi:alkanesulfonate monooxygenase SsuD/methylene tetrahydromethanopterin reductase-like flavin-dependent oxidoreductase (luciferase family)
VDIGLGLPTTVPDLEGPELLDWARGAEECGFDSIAVLDRLVWDNAESLVTLAAAAAVTERVRLVTTVLLAAYRDSVALLAKQLATIDRLSRGRLVLGVAAGGREDDFTAAGAPYAARGRRLDAMLTELRATWTDPGSRLASVGPKPWNGGPPLLVGGHSAAAMRRAAEHGTGWIAGGSSVTSYPVLVDRARQEWAARGRTDQPRMVALSYVALGPDGRERATRYLGGYYGFARAKAEQAAAGVLTDPDAVHAAVAGYAAAGCDELVFFPCDAEPERVRDIAAAAGR